MYAYAYQPLMTHELLGYIAGVLMILSFGPYIRDTIVRTTKPERASWLIWSVLNLIVFFSQWAEGASDSLWLTAGIVAGDISVFLLSIRYGLGGFDRKDIIALSAAVFGLLLWYVTDEPSVALFIAIFIDAIGGYLTVSKTYQHPNSETVSTWVLSLLAGFVAIFSVDTFSLVLLAYPVYTFLLGGVVVAAVILRRRKQCISPHKD